MKFSLNTETIRNSQLSHYSIAAYITIKQLAQISAILGRHTFHVTASQIPTILDQSQIIPNSQKVKSGLQVGLQTLIDQKYVTPVSSFVHHKQQYYIFDTEYILEDTDCFGNVDANTIPKYFTSIDTTEIYNIFSIPDIDHYVLLRLFVVIASTFTVHNSFNSKASKNSVFPNAIGTMTQEVISKMAGLHITTTRKYINYLEDAELLFVYYHRPKKDTHNTPNKIAPLTNCYGRVADKQCIIDYAKSREEKITVCDDRYSREQANNNRRLKQIYNNILKGKSYPDSDIIASYNYIQSKNKTLPTPFPTTIYDNFDCIRKISEQNVEV